MCYNSSMNDSAYVTLSEAAKILDVSRKVIYRLIRVGKLTTHRKPVLEGGPHRIPRAEVESLRPRPTS